MLKTYYSTISGTDFQFFHKEIYTGKISIHFEDERASIWNVEINPKFRGEKLGQKMMNEALDLLQNEYPEFSYVYLLVDVSNYCAQHVYSKLGFEIISEGEFPHTWKMGLDLKHGRILLDN